MGRQPSGIQRFSYRERVLARVTCLVVILGAELAGISYRFDTWVLADNTQWSAMYLMHLPAMGRIGVASAAAILIILAPRWKSTLWGLVGYPNHPHSCWWVWLLLHGLCFGVFAFSTSLILGAPTDSFRTPASWLIGWTAIGGATLVLWFLAVAPPSSWLWLARREYRALAAGVLAGIATWAGGLLIQELWRPLAGATLWLVHRLLAWSPYPLLYDAHEGVLGTPSFQVQIAPECSGYEGIALIAVFLVVYLWLFRNQLRFPHALLLLPLGVLAIWIANAVRIGLLIVIGTSFSPEVAVGGFHSQAGWIAFTVISVGLIALVHRSRIMVRPGTGSLGDTKGAQLASALLVPFLVLMAATMVTSALSSGFDALYPLRVLATGAALWFYRKDYLGLGWLWSWQAAALGGVVFLVWVALEPVTKDEIGGLESGLSQLSGAAAAGWLGFRVLGSVITVPLAEELAFRGYLIRKLVARDFENVRPDRFVWLPFVVSSVLFGLLHGRWLAGTLTGMAYAFALYRRGHLGDAVAAHMCTNALIAAYVLTLGRWSLW